MPGWPIPPEFPLESLLGQEATQICVGLAQAQVHFYKQNQSGTPNSWEPGARIDIESPFTLESQATGTVTVEPQAFKTLGGVLANLLGEVIIEALKMPNNELRLAFSNGYVLHLHTDPQGFESYHLLVAGQSITVTRG